MMVTKDRLREVIKKYLKEIWGHVPKTDESMIDYFEKVILKEQEDD